MGQALYRKYRSKSLSEIVGQTHITTTLQNALKSGRISHAYLFTGPHGVGKTSIARILAYELNKLPYAEDENHLDIIEIDAASNRRIDEIREIRDKVHIAPTSATYKVYIIDEVHMLTKEAFNALLKTLEEPPKHVVFILATTEAHKLPETIISRTQRYTFKPVAEADVISHLKYIASQEKIAITDDALQLLAKHGRGSFRDSINLLDQISGLHQKIDVSDIEQLLGIANESLVSKALSVIKKGSPQDAVAIIEELSQNGISSARFASQLSEALRSHLLQGNTSIGHHAITQLLAQLLVVPTHSNPDRYLELLIIEATVPNQSSTQAAPTTQDVLTVPIEKTLPKAEQIKDVTPKPTVKPVPAATKKQAEPVASSSLSSKALPFDTDMWAEALKRIKQTHNTLYGLARMATPHIDSDVLILEFGFAFHQKQLSDQKNQQIIRDIVSELTKKPIKLQLIVKQTVTKQAPKSDTLDAITNIFGGGEVLGD